MSAKVLFFSHFYIYRIVQFNLWHMGKHACNHIHSIAESISLFAPFAPLSLHLLRDVAMETGYN